ncbi:MAG: hypothetical protein QOH50_1324 [Kribbellaceae bacterium]|jgi:hypothetical protein|nr:hypothetical protein [Kribbellaceae bacterium]
MGPTTTERNHHRLISATQPAPDVDNWLPCPIRGSQPRAPDRPLVPPASADPGLAQASLALTAQPTPAPPATTPAPPPGTDIAAEVRHLARGTRYPPGHPAPPRRATGLFDPGTRDGRNRLETVGPDCSPLQPAGGFTTHDEHQLDRRGLKEEAEFCIGDDRYIDDRRYRFPAVLTGPWATSSPRRPRRRPPRVTMTTAIRASDERGTRTQLG